MLWGLGLDSVGAGWRGGLRAAQTTQAWAQRPVRSWSEQLCPRRPYEGASVSAHTGLTCLLWHAPQGPPITTELYTGPQTKLRGGCWAWVPLVTQF